MQKTGTLLSAKKGIHLGRIIFFLYCRFLYGPPPREKREEERKFIQRLRQRSRRRRRPEMGLLKHFLTLEATEKWYYVVERYIWATNGFDYDSTEVFGIHF